MPQILNVHIFTASERNPISTIGLIVNIETYASPDATEIRFSNDGTTFSPYEPIAQKKFNWDLSTFGGSSAQGFKTVYVQVRNLALIASVIATSRIFLGTQPFIEFTDVAQRADNTAVDVTLKAHYDFTVAVSVPTIEYSLTGAFAGEELPASIETDIASLKATRAGKEHVIVWDAVSDLGSGIFSSAARLRANAEFFNVSGTLNKSSAFTVDTRTIPTVSGKSVIRGNPITLSATMRSDSGALFNPTLVEIISITDPVSVNHLGSPVTVVPTSVGIFDYLFSVLATDPLGQWRYVYRSTVGTIVKLHEFFFKVVAPVANVSVPSVSGACVIEGDIVGPNGQPLLDTTGPNGEPKGVVIEFHSAGRRGTGAVITATAMVSTQADANGHFKVELIQGGEFTVFIPLVNYRRTVKIPNTPTAQFDTLLEVALPTRTHDPFGNS